jgi:hypothetical protein
MMPRTLESIPLERLDEMAAPFRDALRAEYGDTVKAYRGESGGRQSEGRKNILGSYTTDRKVAERFAGVPQAREYPVISDEAIATAERQLAETGEATIGGRTYRLTDSKYIDMYDQNGDLITDTTSIADSVGADNAYAMERNAQRAEALSRVREVSIPVDDIMAATDRFNQKELIARFLYSNAKPGAAVPLAIDAAERAQADGLARALAGGQTGVNGYIYKGGQFLPNTTAPPGTWRIKSGGKATNLANRQELVGPGAMELSPTPFARPVFGAIKDLVNIGPDGTATLKTSINWDYFGSPDEKRPMQFKNLAKSAEGYSTNDLVDLYNKGVRWIDTEPMAGVEIIDKATDLKANAPTGAAIPAGMEASQDDNPALIEYLRAMGVL